VGKLCNGVQITRKIPATITRRSSLGEIQALAFKAIRRLYPDYPVWRDFF
jgi:hypothetical protein